MRRSVFFVAVYTAGVFTFATPLAWAQSHVDSQEILVIDFIGFADSGKDHAQTVQDLLPLNADLVSVGIHGKAVNDAKRSGAGYTIIVPANSKADYTQSSQEVYQQIKHDRTILAFDFNEHGLPQQFRRDYPLPTAFWLLPNKIYHPAMVAAQVAETWQQQHPDGQLILRGHSDGTYALNYIFDYLKSKGRPPQALILESPRQAQGDWRRRALLTPETLFLSITSTADLPRETFFDTGYASVPSSNWVNLHVQGVRNPLAAHSVVTEYRKPDLKIQRSDATGQTFTSGVTLGELIKHEVSSFVSQHISGAVDINRGRRSGVLPERREGQNSRGLGSSLNNPSTRAPQPPDRGGTWGQVTISGDVSPTQKGQ